jgi:perosamine synthetase
VANRSALAGNPLLRWGYHLSQALLRSAKGGPLALPSLGSMTLDEDDVQLAEEWRQRPDEWYRLDEVEQYQAAFARWNGSAHAFAFMGGRVALSAIIQALGLRPGDEVILPGYTCIVVANAFQYAGVKMVFSDIELDSYGLDAALIEAKITPQTKAILLQHLYGLVCRDYEAILAIGRRRHLLVIEDCAHSTGAEYRGKKVGNWGDVAFYSSEQSKVFNTVVGGVATTNHPEVAGKLANYFEEAAFPDPLSLEKQLQTVVLNYYQYKDRQRWWRGDWLAWRLGHKRLISTTPEEERNIRPADYGRKMAAPVAALGLNQLKKIDGYNERRRQTARRWDQWCDGRHYQKPLVIAGSTPVYLRYPVLVESEKKQNREWAVRELGVQPGVWFVSQLHPVPGVIANCPNAETAVRQCINLPCLL